VLKIKGELITAKTEVSLQQNTTAFFKVTETPASGKDLKLQFVGYEEESLGDSSVKSFLNTPEGRTLTRLMQELSDSLLKVPGKVSPENKSGTLATNLQAEDSPENASLNKFPLDKIESLLKALPKDINALPKDMKVQLQDLLTASLKSTGQSIQSRLDNVLNRLPDALKNNPLIQNLKAELMVNIEKLMAGPFKSALQNTGVALEAKLKSVVASIQLQQMEDGEAGAQPAKAFEETLKSAVVNELLKKAEGEPEDIKSGQLEKAKQAGAALQQDKARPELSALKNDLKAVLLELKQRLSERSEDIAAGISSNNGALLTKEAVQDSIPLKNLHVTIEGLLKDIETFQALSKTTDSFYTFLPLNWKGLRDGEIAFKRGRSDSDGRSSCSCRMNLDLENLGNLSVLVLMHNREFFVSFKAEKPEFHSTINSNLDELKTTFREKGLNLKAVNALDKDDHSLEQLERLESFERIVSIKA
ncbi:MAG: flagellar hook-length control protein FliK, partial [Nitrospirae bacterium]|nr:flagellar hook-length control protein FliK [Nitrospirota bacterium]